MSNAAPPLISVVVPAHNAERTILSAVDSVLAQTFPDWELIVCDDASTDSTPALVQQRLLDLGVARARVITLAGGGAAATRNHGIRAARGEFVAFLDDDDTWLPTKLARCVDALRSGPLDIVCHAEIWVDEAGRGDLHDYTALFDTRVHPLVSLMRRNPFSTSALVVRRQHLLDAGLFDPSLPSAEDYDLWIRLAMRPGVRIGFIGDPLGTYRLRSGSESSKIDKRLLALLAIGQQYAEPLAAASPLGRLEPWIYRAKTYFTSGLRYLQRGSHGRGLVLALRGLLMWPFRLDLVRTALDARAQSRRTVRGAVGPN